MLNFFEVFHPHGGRIRVLATLKIDTTTTDHDESERFFWNKYIYEKRNCAVSAVTLSASSVAVGAHMNRWLSYRIAHHSSLYELLKLREWERYVWEYFRISDVITLEKINVYCTYMIRVIKIDIINTYSKYGLYLLTWVYMLLLNWIQLYRLTENNPVFTAEFSIACRFWCFLLCIVSSLHHTWTSTLTVDRYRE